MSGETNIEIILKNLSPIISKELFVFISISNDAIVDWISLHPLGSFREKEGLTIILEQGVADEYAFPYTEVFHCITLQIHSSLEAVGLTDFVSNTLAKNNIPANVIAAYHHDHIFVPASKAHRALDVLCHAIKLEI